MLRANYYPWKTIKMLFAMQKHTKGKRWGAYIISMPLLYQASGNPLPKAASEPVNGWHCRLAELVLLIRSPQGVLVERHEDPSKFLNERPDARLDRRAHWC